MNRKEAVIGSDILRGFPEKSTAKAPASAMGNWRDNDYDSADLDRTIILIDSHTYPEEGQGFF
ncbi:MAG: hypothetical protein ACLRJV_12960 [Eubacteriales bacterium]